MPNSISQDLRDALLAVLDEAFSQSSRDWRYFTEPSQDSGYFGVLASLTHEEAAQVVGGTSIAAQVQHVILVLRSASALIEGAPDPPDLEAWQHSWQVSGLDAEGWKAIHTNLRSAYEELRGTIEHSGMSRSAAMANAIGSIAHVAYHLGAIKQKLKIIR